MLNKIKKLKKGDTIGIINPAFCNPANNDYKAMFAAFEEYGFKVKLGKTYTLKEGYLAGSDKERALDVMEMFTDPEVDGIICMRGGYGASRMVDLLDYEVIKQNPKFFAGFSDITVLLNNITQKSKFPTIHGLVGCYLGAKKYEGITREDFEQILFKNQKGRVLKGDGEKVVTINGGIANGVTAGGNLSLLATLAGSPYEVDFTDKIVLIEEVGEEPYQIDRYLSSLRLNGSLNKAKGFILGYFTDCNPGESKKNDQSVMDVINDYFKDLGKPTIFNFPIGHDFPTLNLPIGVEVVLDANNKSVEIKGDIYDEDEAN